MIDRYIFHLSLPVDDLVAAEQFYVRVLGATIGRRDPEWVDALLWGHQITLQLQPEQVLTAQSQGKRHFGVILPWPQWQQLAQRLAHESVEFLSPPQVHHPGTPQEQAKLYLRDPAHNVIEIKAYRDSRSTVGCGDSNYGYPD